MTTLLEAWAIAAARECEAASLWERCTPDDEWRAADAHVRAYEQLQEATNHLRAAALRANRLDPERPAPYPVAVFIDRCLVVVSPSPDDFQRSVEWHRAFLDSHEEALFTAGK